jgi:hypothetical protein
MSSESYTKGAYFINSKWIIAIFWFPTEMEYQWQFYNPDLLVE